MKKRRRPRAEEHGNWYIFPRRFTNHCAFRIGNRSRTQAVFAGAFSNNFLLFLSRYRKSENRCQTTRTRRHKILTFFFFWFSSRRGLAICVVRPLPFHRRFARAAASLPPFLRDTPRSRRPSSRGTLTRPKCFTTKYDRNCLTGRTVNYFFHFCFCRSTSGFFFFIIVILYLYIFMSRRRSRRVRIHAVLTKLSRLAVLDPLQIQQ